MDDKELLELAAKAAGVGPLDFDYADREGHGLYLGPRLPMKKGVMMAAMWDYWNPLDDDGDALRLAVKLGMLFSYMTDRFEMFQRFYLEELDNDLKPSEATRRAVVRAGAEIGKAMQ